MTSTRQPTTASRAMRAGVIGLGMIGGGVAVSLARRGLTPAVYDVRPDAADGLAGVPVPVASPAQVARDSDVVLIAVATAGQAMAVLAGDDGVLSAGRAGLIAVLLSTVSPAELRELAAVCARAGVTLLDAGVSGGPVAADNGLVVMVGGSDEAVARARPVLDGFASSVVHCGPLGTGMVAKLARNLLSYATWAAVREAATIAEAGGVPLDRLLAVLEAAARNGGTDPLVWLRLQVAGRPLTDGHADFIDWLAQKDLAAAQDLAGEAGIEVPLADVARPRGTPVEHRHDQAPLRPGLEPAVPDPARPAVAGPRRERHARPPRSAGEPASWRDRQRGAHRGPAPRDRPLPPLLHRVG